MAIDRGQRQALFVPRQPTLDTLEGIPCPFCPGNEGSMLPALEAYGTSGGWLVRVVPNRYPAFEGDDPFVVENRGPVFTEAPASGIHEVLILSPDHDSKIECPLAAARFRRASYTGAGTFSTYKVGIVNS